MAIQDTRRRRLRQLIDDRFDGVDAKFADDIEIAPTQVARWFMTNRHRRNVGEKLARAIETKAGLPKGWLDTSEVDDPNVARETPAVYSTDPELRATLLALFDQLTDDQRQEVIKECEAYGRANEAVLRELGNRTRRSKRERATDRGEPATSRDKRS